MDVVLLYAPHSSGSAPVDAAVLELRKTSNLLRNEFRRPESRRCDAEYAGGSSMMSAAVVPVARQSSI